MKPLRRKGKKQRRNPIPLIAYSNPRLQISEQFRLVRTNIQFASVDNEVKSIMVTSPEPADGKSTTAANLAIVLAQQEKKVLIVDTDLRKPSVHLTFHLSNNYGLTNVLTRVVPLEDAISDTYIKNLHVLPSGPIPPNPSELLSSHAMELVMNKLGEWFDYVIFDTPPILAVTDSQIMANKCAGVILVVASGKTTKDMAIKAKQLLERANSRILGVVVNGVKSKKNDYYY